MTNEIAIKEPMRLTSENVEAVFKDCLTDEHKFVVKGVCIGAAFDRDKIEAHEDEIFQMLMQLPAEFHTPCGGGGWTFLNMCIDRDGNQWTDFHQIMDMLVCLGLAIGAVEFLFKQRDLWQTMPGGMPYLSINDNYKTAAI